MRGYKRAKKAIAPGFIFLLAFFGGSIVNVSSSPPVAAHRDGCHRWHSCPSDTGSYVCGDLGYTSECPAAAAPTPTYVAPVITKRTITEDEDINFQSITEYTSKEYSDYFKLKQDGSKGKKRKYIELTLTDGRETSRKEVSSELVANPQNKIEVRGVRIKPEAKITKANKTKRKDKYDIVGEFKPNSEVVLAVNGKKIKRVKTDKNGKFVFKSIKLSSINQVLEIHKRERRRENQISERTKINLQTGEPTTEYQSFHTQ